MSEYPKWRKTLKRYDRLKNPPTCTACQHPAASREEYAVSHMRGEDANAVVCEHHANDIKSGRFHHFWRDYHGMRAAAADRED